MNDLTKRRAKKLSEGDEVWVKIGNPRDPDGEVRGYVLHLRRDEHFDVCVPGFMIAPGVKWPGQWSPITVSIRGEKDTWSVRRNVPHTALMVR